MIEDSERLFSRYAHELTDVHPDCFANCFGLQTHADLFHSTAAFAGKTIPGYPIPDDRVYGGQAEYAALLTAFDRRLDQASFTAVELGAGWGPWISLAGVVAKRESVSSINLVAVEASELKVSALKEHLRRNQILNGPGLSAKVIHGAAWKENTTLFFPKEMPITDYGGAASDTDSRNDYRGFAYETTPVPAYSLDTICGELKRVDYMHWDIQGAERELAKLSTEFLMERVKYIFIGTHSRAIEGALMEIFFDMKGTLLWQQPCAFKFDLDIPTLEGMTTTDGEMIWTNPHI